MPDAAPGDATVGHAADAWAVDARAGPPCSAFEKGAAGAALDSGFGSDGGDDGNARSAVGCFRGIWTASSGAVATGGGIFSRTEDASGAAGAGGGGGAGMRACAAIMTAGAANAADAMAVARADPPLTGAACRSSEATDGPPRFAAEDSATGGAAAACARKPNERVVASRSRRSGKKSATVDAARGAPASRGAGGTYSAASASAATTRGCAAT